MTDFEVIFCQNLESAPQGPLLVRWSPNRITDEEILWHAENGVISGLKMIDFDVTRNLIMFDPYSHYLGLFKVIFYFPNGKSTIWGIYSEYFLFFGHPLSKSKIMS